MEWRSMETAPRDGTEFLAMGMFGPEIARYNRVKGHFTTHLSTPEPVRDDYLSCWMPLPAPPEGAPPERLYPRAED